MRVSCHVCSNACLDPPVIDPGFLQAEEEAGAEAAPHRSGQYPRGIGPPRATERRGFVQEELGDPFEAEVGPKCETSVLSDVDGELIFRHG